MGKRVARCQALGKVPGTAVDLLAYFAQRGSSDPGLEHRSGPVFAVRSRDLAIPGEQPSRCDNPKLRRPPLQGVRDG